MLLLVWVLGDTSSSLKLDLHQKKILHSAIFITQNIWWYFEYFRNKSTQQIAVNLLAFRATANIFAPVHHT